MTSDDICQLLSTFRDECAIETYRLPFETILTIEEQLVAALPSVRGLSEKEIANVHAFVDLHLAVLLNRFSSRMVNAAISLNDDALVECAIVALSLDRDLLDQRDVCRTGALIIDCCNRCGLTSKSLYMNYLTSATESRKALLLRQCSTAPGYMRSLRAMKFGVVHSRGKFKYIDHMFDS